MDAVSLVSSGAGSAPGWGSLLNTAASFISKFGGGSGTYAQTTGYRLRGSVGPSGFSGQYFALANNAGTHYEDIIPGGGAQSLGGFIADEYRKLFGQGPGPTIPIDVVQPLGGSVDLATLGIQQLNGILQEHQRTSGVTNVQAPEIQSTSSGTATGQSMTGASGGASTVIATPAQLVSSIPQWGIAAAVILGAVYLLGKKG